VFLWCKFRVGVWMTGAACRTLAPLRPMRSPPSAFAELLHVKSKTKWDSKRTQARSKVQAK
jgi:hypothetical protein